MLIFVSNESFFFHGVDYVAKFPSLMSIVHVHNVKKNSFVDKVYGFKVMIFHANPPLIPYSFDP